MSGGRPPRMNRALLQDLADELRVDPVYLERDFVLTEIIRRLAEGEQREQLVLKGGQALRHIYGSVRFSKDADYVATKRIEFGALRAAIDVRHPRLVLPDRPEGRTGSSIKIAPIGYRSLLGLESTVEVEVSFRGDLELAPQRQTYDNAFGDDFEILVMNLNEMVSEKVRALYQRGHPRDLYDLWFVLTSLADRLAEETIKTLIPVKLKPPLVRAGWDYRRLYEQIEKNAWQWESLLAGLVPDPPGYDEALSVAQRGLRFLREVRPVR